MIVKTLDDKTIEWKIPEKIIKGKKRKSSKQHQRAYQILSSIYPNIPIYEEVPITIQRGKKLFLDFYIKTINTAIEVHGEQHYSYNSFFYKSKLDFYKKIKNDRDKKEWCEINEIKLIELPHNLSDEQWIALIQN